MKPLKLNRTTIRNLNNDELSDVGGGTIVTRPTILVTARCPLPTLLCPTTGTRTSAVDACPSALACPPTSIFDPGPIRGL
jgi:hypothetical protein